MLTSGWINSFKRITFKPKSYFAYFSWSVFKQLGLPLLKKWKKQFIKMLFNGLRFNGILYYFSFLVSHKQNKSHLRISGNIMKCSKLLQSLSINYCHGNQIILVLFQNHYCVIMRQWWISILVRLLRCFNCQSLMKKNSLGCSHFTGILHSSSFSCFRIY